MDIRSTSGSENHVGSVLATEMPPRHASMQVKATPRRIAALDGLRGIAILLVILFHVDLGLNPADPFAATLSRIAKCGWIGVDIFFVLSGFLITGILLDSKMSPSYYCTFYARRILRIFPLYYLTLAAVFFVVPWFIGEKSERMQFLFDHQLWFWSFLSNAGYVVERRAFGNADWLWLDHFWSLALEEQFYVIWPFVIRRLSCRQIVQVSVAMVGCSLLLRIGLASIGMRPSALYFPTPCRLDGLAVGSILAVVKRSLLSPIYHKMLISSLASAIAVLSGILIYRGGLFFHDKLCLTIGLTAISITAGGLVWWASSVSTGLGSTGIQNPLLLAMGKYSYGIYVLHHLLLPILFYRLPVKAIALRTGSMPLATLFLLILAFLMSIFSGFLSWHLLEKHFLKFKSRFNY